MCQYSKKQTNGQKKRKTDKTFFKQGAVCNPPLYHIRPKHLWCPRNYQYAAPLLQTVPLRRSTIAGNQAVAGFTVAHCEKQHNRDFFFFKKGSWGRRGSHCVRTKGELPVFQTHFLSVTLSLSLSERAQCAGNCCLMHIVHQHWAQSVALNWKNYSIALIGIHTHQGSIKVFLLLF